MCGIWQILHNVVAALFWVHLPFSHLRVFNCQIWNAGLSVACQSVLRHTSQSYVPKFCVCVCSYWLELSNNYNFQLIWPHFFSVVPIIQTIILCTQLSAHQLMNAYPFPLTKNKPKLHLPIPWYGPKSKKYRAMRNWNSCQLSWCDKRQLRVQHDRL